MNFVPGGVNDVALKLKFPKNSAWANNEGLKREDCRRFSVRTACGRIMSQYMEGNSGCQAHIAAMRWFMKVRIDISAVLRQ